MKVTREMVNKSQHLVTDYQYEGDNLGIDLYLLNQQKTIVEQTIPGIEITDYDQNFLNSKKDIRVSGTLRYEDSKIQAIISAIYSDNTNVFNLEISDETFAEDMIQHCLINKKGVKTLPCYESAMNHVIEQVKEEASRCLNCKNALCMQGCPVSINIPAFIEEVIIALVTDLLALSGIATI